MSTNVVIEGAIRASEQRVGVPEPSPRLQRQLEEAARLIENNHRFLVTSHEYPDGDAIGSTLAFCHLLRAMGKDAVVFNVDPVPWNFKFLPGADTMRRVLDTDESFDVTCVLDCSTQDRVGPRFPAHGWSDLTLAIDHHRGPYLGADALVHDASAASVGELIYRLACQLDVPIDLSMAECIYCSLMTDTGSFRYSNTSPTALAIAAALVEVGVDVWNMTSNVYECNPVQRVRLLAHVLETLYVSDCGRLATVEVRQEMFAATGADESMTDGFINHARAIRGVEVAAQLKEIESDHFYVSFRSRGGVNVGALAERFGGGGHQNAAGCNIRGNSQDVAESLAEQLVVMLDGNGSNG